MDKERLLGRWRTNRAAARPRTGRLSDGRPTLPPGKVRLAPPPPEAPYSDCQRCGLPTEEIACLFGDYWLCPECRKAFDGLAAYGKRVALRSASAPPLTPELLAACRLIFARGPRSR